MGPEWRMGVVDGARLVGLGRRSFGRSVVTACCRPSPRYLPECPLACTGITPSSLAAAIASLFVLLLLLLLLLLSSSCHSECCHSVLLQCAAAANRRAVVSFPAWLSSLLSLPRLPQATVPVVIKTTPNDKWPSTSTVLLSALTRGSNAGENLLLFGTR
jgi:hypothetical protein